MVMGQSSSTHVTTLRGDRTAGWGKGEHHPDTSLDRGTWDNLLYHGKFQNQGENLG